MELNGTHPLVPVTDAGNRPVVQVPVGDFKIRGKPFCAHRVSVVLRRDENASRAKILHRLVRATVSEPQLEGRCAEREREDLVTKTNAVDRLHLGEAAGCFMRRGQDRGITGTIGKEDAVGIERQ